MRTRRHLFSFRRYSRIAAVFALHVAEGTAVNIQSGLRHAFDLLDSEDVRDEVFQGLAGDPEELAAAQDAIQAFATHLAEGVWNVKFDLDDRIAETIPGYDYSRLASVDRNVLRVALWELENVPFVPPAVTINEAVEIAKRYSTAESGKFVNGVLGTLVQTTTKAHWDPATAPPDPDLEEPETVEEPSTVEAEIEVEVVEESSEEGKTASRFGVWRLRSGDEEIPPSTS